MSLAVAPCGSTAAAAGSRALQCRSAPRLQNGSLIPLRVSTAGRRPLRMPPAVGAAHAAAADGAALQPGAVAAAVLSAFEGADGAGSKQLRDFCEVAYLSGRAKIVCDHFPDALGVDDFLHRMEIALFAYGFNGDNSIAMVNLCRDEVTNTLKHKFDSIFGSTFNTNGLGGVLTCGVSGVAAGLSHAPISRSSGKERYVFFSMPHISIDARGNVGSISRPGRSGLGCACGALSKALLQIKRDGLASNCKIPGVHEPRDPEFTILKQRLARRLRYEGTSDDTVSELGLVDITAVAERTITDDLEYLISQTVDPKKADYAVVAGVQIHNWGARFDDPSPNLEFVAPTHVYVVVNGEKTHLDLNSMPSLTPRQVQLLAAGQGGPGGGHAGGGRGYHETVCNSGGTGTVREIDPPYEYNSRDQSRRERERADTYASLLQEEGLQPQVACPWPSWQSSLRAGEPHREEHDSSVVIDHSFESDDELDEMWAKLQDKYIMPAPSQATPSSSSASDSGAQQDSQAGSQGGITPQHAPGSSIGNGSAPASLSTAAVGAAAGPGDSNGGEAAAPAPPKMGLLGRLLQRVKDGKGRQQPQPQPRQGRE